MLKASKVRIYPTTEQAEFLNSQFGAVRFVYNKGLHIKALLPVAKRSRKYHFLKQFDSIALQQACINLDKAFSNFFNQPLSARYPCFKRKQGKQSSYYCTSISVGANWIKVPKCQPIKAKIHRGIGGQLKSITLSKTPTGKYFASLLVEDGIETPELIRYLNDSQVVGLDAGLTHLLIQSDGKKIDNPRVLTRAANHLRRKQKKLSRKQKGSVGRNKARLLVAKCHERTANARNDFQHKLSKRLVDENLESLNVNNRLKNHKLAKHIVDASWSSLGEKIAYKAKMQGKHKIEIDTFFASTCNACGHKVEKMPLNVRVWDCTSCGNKSIDRDINAALNIKQQGILKLKAAGLTVSANGGLRQSVTSTVAA